MDEQTYWIHRYNRYIIMFSIFRIYWTLYSEWYWDLQTDGIIILNIMIGPRQRTSKHRPPSPRGGFGGAPSKGVSNGCVRMGSSGRIFDWTEYVRRMAANLKSCGDPRRNWGLGNKVLWVHSGTRCLVT